MQSKGNICVAGDFIDRTIFAYLATVFPAFPENRMLNFVFTRDCHLTLPWYSGACSIISYPVLLLSIWILSRCLNLELPTFIFRSYFSIKVLHKIFLLPRVYPLQCFIILHCEKRVGLQWIADLLVINPFTMIFFSRPLCLIFVPNSLF
jgi:hypothetical protein